MAVGRARALLGYGLAHFGVYIGSVVLVAHLGLTAVAIDASVVHGLFLIVAYVVMLHGREERPLRALWQDVDAATTSCAAMGVAMVPVALLASTAALPAPLTLLSIGLAGGFAYLLVLRIAFAQSWLDLVTLVRRVLPARLLDPRIIVLSHKKLRARFVGKAT
jgi:hypothetical protein